MKKRALKKSIALCCSITMLATSIPFTAINIKAATGDFFDENNSVMIDKGGYKKEVFGVRTDDWGVNWTDRKESLPPSKVYLTDNYKETVGTVPTNDWESSVVFDQYSESLYAHPLAYRAASNGMQMASPAVVDSTSYVDGEPTVESLLNDDTVEMVVGGENFSAKDAKVDKTTDWSYEIVMADNAGNSSMRSIIAKGTPYAYYTFDNVTPTISLGAGATDLAIVKNTTSSNIIGVSLKNKKDGKIHYYMLAAPSGTTWINAGGKLTAKMPSGKNYMSVAILPDGSNEAFSLYEKYAFNFITDTKVQWEYLKNSSKVVTKYNVTTKNMENGSTGGDTIMALYPHQWRYSNSKYTNYTYKTIRGTMKTIVGTSYVTEMQYNGILSSLPVTTDENTIGNIKQQLGYLYDYRKNKEDPKWICNLEGQYGGFDTYWIGKNLNTLSDAIWLSGQLDGDDADMKNITNEMVEGVENYLEFWFDPYQAYISGDNKDDYFYYDENYGTLIGYPSSYDSDKQVNDHHFHYGYWIKAAAAVAMKDPQWAKEWGGMVYEMIGDIANVNRDGKGYNANSPTKYPFLRNFDIYEGHSWASGVANYEYDENGELVDKKGGLSGGNNQESSSEAINAWASLILWGEAVGNTTIRDAGIYMYTTEIAAIEDYYYDVHNEIFTEKYKDAGNYNIQTVTRLFGGRYDHTAWWTENSIEVTTITMLPISGATLYMGKYKDKVKNVVDSIDENSNQWKHFVSNKEQICNNFNKVDMLTDPKTNQDVVAEYYAYYDPDGALARWDMSDSGKVENGESRAHTLSYITSLQKYGNQDFSITGSEPLSLVLSKDGNKTYVAENHTDEVKRVYFTDNTYVDVPANSSYVGPKTGNGSNPNVDESELLGNTSKVNVEIYLENYEGTGYEKQEKQVSVKEGTTSYTYEPENITGFTYDNGNSNNILTTVVKEDNTATVKAYYKRNSYTIQYELNDGTNNDANPNGYRFGSSIKLNNPTREGYKFLGWYTDDNYQNQITEITDSTAENLVLYAKFLDESTISQYTVEYYKQKEDESGYDLVTEDTERIEAIIGTEVSAEEKEYDGYILSENSVTKGIVIAEGKLVLRLYYDIKKSPESRIQRGAYVDENGKLNFIAKDDVNSAIVYYEILNGKTEAEAFYKQAVETNGGNCPGYPMNKTDIGFKKIVDQEVTGEQYVVFRFNINDKELTDWVISKISDVEKVSTETKPAPTTTVATTTTIASTTESPEVDPSVDESIKTPEGLVWAGNAQLPYYFAWARADGVDSYNVYVNGVFVKNVVDGNVNLDYTAFTKGSGEYEIGVATVKGNKRSRITSIMYNYVDDGNHPTTTVAPTTAAPTTTVAPTTTTAPTTKAPTTTAAPTTVAPITTAAPTTTVALTTKDTEQETTTNNGAVTSVETSSTYKTAEQMEKEILEKKDDKDFADSTFAKLSVRVKKTTKKSVKLVWKKMSGATKYVIYGAKCGTSYKKIKEVSKKTFTANKLKKGKYYKYLVVAQNDKGEVLATSKLIHVATKGGKVGNCKSLKLNKTKVKLLLGKKFKIKVKQIADSKNVKIKKHRKVSFESSNPEIATVSKRGKITALKRGKCTIYAYAQNGVYKKVKVTIK